MSGMRAERVLSAAGVGSRSGWWSAPKRCGRRAALRATNVVRQLKRNLHAAVAGEDWTWKRFHTEVRASGARLLEALPRFPNAVLVAGCQRSGTTAIARLLARSEGMAAYRRRSDDELDAALILAGLEGGVPAGRYCFQTTYLNEAYREYFGDGLDFKLVWVLRNPYSVVCSMRYNWDRFALDELFEACGRPLLESLEGERAGKAARRLLGSTRKACLAYAGKQMQAFELAKGLGERMRIVDYEALVQPRGGALPALYEYLGLKYAPDRAKALHDRSLRKAEMLSRSDRRLIEALCVPTYEAARMLVRRSAPFGPR